MTSKLTKEWLQHQISAIQAVGITDSNTLAAFKLALAAMDSEPVFTLEVARADYKGQKLGNHFGFITLDAARELKEGNYQLYRHAQPAPVVSEEMTPEMMRSVQLNSELGAYAASNLSGAYDLFAEFWKVACRAAMINGGKP